jgi:DNA-directed RNA polymerase subunit M
MFYGLIYGGKKLEFCTICGSRLKPTKSHSGDQAMVMLTCTKCGQKKPEAEPNPKLYSKIIEHSPKQFVAIIGKEEQELTTLPTIRADCPKCGNNLANVWQVQTRGSDESSTQFLRCTQCNYTYREST